MVRPDARGIGVSTSRLLFSFEGRISRQPYWLVSIAMIVLTMVVLVVVLGTLLVDGVAAVAGAPWLLIIYGPLIWIGLAVATKRLHDRNKSGWWLVPFYALPVVLDGVGSALDAILGIVLSLASLAISIWALVELGFLRGTPGPNRYGPDPLSA
jgi:uncharacterized membrane protein YhaH (DUF805 family)